MLTQPPGAKFVTLVVRLNCQQLYRAGPPRLEVYGIKYGMATTVSYEPEI